MSAPTNPSNGSNPSPAAAGSSGLTRRDFVKFAVATGISMTAASPSLAAETKSNGMQYRNLGRTGEKVSILGVGGFHIGSPDESVGIRIVREAIDAGVNFMDNSWDYHDGGSERRMGKALRDGYRDKAFLMTKIDGRDKKSAAKQLDESLSRLQTDRLDLLQFHEIIRMEDPDRIFADDGAIHAVQEAQKAGKVRFIGFTGHKDPLVHLRMLDVAKEHGFRFDAVQMPLNVMDAHFRSFQHQVVPRLVDEEIGVLGMKPLADGLILQSKTVQPIECLHYAMNLPTSTVITGMDNMDRLHQGLQAARSFKPLSHENVSHLLAQTAQAAATGRFEKFKTDTPFDATARHPEWLGS